MTYRVLRETSDRVTVLQDEQTAFLLMVDAHGIWAAYDCRHPDRYVLIDQGLNLDVVLGRVCSGLLSAGHLAKVGDGFVIPAPQGAHEFYLSGTGFLCASQPVARVVSQQPVPCGPLALIRTATEVERHAAGLKAGESAVFIRP